MKAAPVVAIDGPTASGKGAVSEGVAAALGWHYLDSGALYRLVGLAALRAGVGHDDPQGLAGLAQGLDVRFDGGGVRLAGEDVSAAIRATEVGAMASRIAGHAPLRAALLDRQRALRRPPGLVADGRDMGTVVFPDAILKIFLTAAVEVRAERRYKQLIEKGFSATLTDLLHDLRERDRRDTERAAAPLVAAKDAVLVDSTERSLSEVIDLVVGLARDRL
ncbi:MAG: (d)CMP kinase [Burkholderiaceae bacterium]|nr:(d)CMP kinase [Burkholderiaceae bacterium]MEB2320763.1 (d)CMP kinase [Pseudomonadota bacterium]